MIVTSQRSDLCVQNYDCFSHFDRINITNVTKHNDIQAKLRRSTFNESLPTILCDDCDITICDICVQNSDCFSHFDRTNITKVTK